MNRIRRGRLLGVLSSIALAALAARAASADQTRGNPFGVESVVEVPISPSATSAVKGAIKSLRHAQPKTGATPEQRSVALRGGAGARLGNNGDGARARGRYPGDVQYQGGETLGSSVQHTIFVNPTATCRSNACWGDPIGFLRDLNRSDFIHVTDQYVGTKADDRYPVGNNYVVNYPVVPGQRLTDLDIEIIAYSAAIFSGEHGYGHTYHVFLAPGQDLCFDGSNLACYSPDDAASFVFCAYHSSFSVNGFGHVIYSAEPFQNVNGCAVRPNTPNGQLADSTDDVLSHEAFEAITDPDGDAWWNMIDNGLFGQEIADECSFVTFTPTNAYGDPSDIRLNGKPYAIQPEYSNAGHVCTVGNAER